MLRFVGLFDREGYFSKVIKFEKEYLGKPFYIYCEILNEKETADNIYEIWSKAFEVKKPDYLG